MGSLEPMFANTILVGISKSSSKSSIICSSDLKQTFNSCTSPLSLHKSYSKTLLLLLSDTTDSAATVCTDIFDNECTLLDHSNVAICLSLFLFRCKTPLVDNDCFIQRSGPHFHNILNQLVCLLLLVWVRILFLDHGLH
jgi:hypothetical protein